MRWRAFKGPHLECWKMERSMKALVVLLLLSVLFGCQKSSDQASSQSAASAVTKVSGQTGRVVVNPQFDAALRFADGLAAVRIGDEHTGKWGYVDKQGKMVANAQFDVAHPFVDGLAAVRIGDESTGKWGYIDKQGKMVISPQFDDTRPIQDGLAAVRIGDEK